MIEILSAAGLAFCASAGVVECRLLDAIHAAVVLNRRRPWVCVAAKPPCVLPAGMSCVTIGRMFIDAETAARYRTSTGWDTWYACSAGES